MPALTAGMDDAAAQRTADFELGLLRETAK
jgi:hypothetical protein